MAQDKLIVHGAREHNLKNIHVEMPRDTFIVITGISGSGKSSLAFDTIYAEGQRRYVESLSAYARQFLGRMEKPDVDQIEGLSPAISIDQRGASHNPRSTVGTVTEIYDYLRLLYARIGIPHCPQCGRVIAKQTPDRIVDDVMALPEGSRIMILAPLVKDRKGHHQRVFDDVRKAGFVRVRVNGEVHDVDERIELDRYKMHTIEAVVDRLIVRRGGNGLDRSRLADSVETALELGDGLMIVSIANGRQSAEGRESANGGESADGRKSADGRESAGGDGRTDEGQAPHDLLFSQHFACPECGISLGEIEPRTFSFNSPHGACPTCQGLGTKMELDPGLIVPNPDLSLSEGAIRPWSRSDSNETYYYQLLKATAEHYGFSTHTPWRELEEVHKAVVLYGSGGETIDIVYKDSHDSVRRFRTTYEGIIPNLQRRYRETDSDYIRWDIEQYMTTRPCPACKGTRLKPEARAVTVAGKSIVEVTSMSITEALDWVKALQGTDGSEGTTGTGGTDLSPSSGVYCPRPPDVRTPFGPQAKPLSAKPLSERELAIAGQVLKELANRLSFMVNVGLDYLTLDRTAGTLAGGEAQRIRLATQIGSQLMGVLYILDEPSIGLHQRDNARLIRTLLNLRDLGNTILVVEHDEETIRSADYIVDLGPGAGEHGGEVVVAGTLDDVMNCPESLTGRYLRRELVIPVPKKRRSGNGQVLVVKGAAENNLKHIDVSFPLGTFTCITGVSGSGKSTLLVEVLYKRLAQMMHGARKRPGAHDDVIGVEHLDKVINIDQSPIGRTPRSNPGTYTNVFTPIRQLFADLPESKVRGYKPGRFSFNVKGGRCDACDGDGTLKIEMHFLPDIYIPCEVCKGARYNRETLQIRYRGKNIADILDMTIQENLEFFQNIPAIRRKLQTLCDVGLGYLKLGQPAPTLSGGEAQRVKLSRELSKRPTGQTLYILDEPTTGLHFDDVKKLLSVLDRLVDKGNTVIVIEHNLDVIKTADWIIDLGPEGGDEGGRVIAEGTPEVVASNPASYTGQFLQRVLAGEWVPAPVLAKA